MRSMARSLLCWVALLLLPITVQAAVYLPIYNETYISLPARFGKQLNPDDPPITAFLTVVRDQPYMCSDELKNIQAKPPFLVQDDDDQYATNNQRNNSTTGLDSEIDSSMRVEDKDKPNITYIPTVSEIASHDVVPLPKPNSDWPVAILVERGMCTFWEKAIMASQYGDFVKYVIVYDDQIAPDLTPMGSEKETDMTLLFVSAATGRALKNYIVLNQQLQINAQKEIDTMSNETVDELEQDDRFFGYNLVVHLDGTSPYFEQTYRGLNMAAYFLAAMSGFLAFLIFFGCLLICAQCGCITAAPDEHGRIVLFAGGPGIRHTEGLARMIRVDKLTTDQVLLLEEEEFEESPDGQDAEENNSTCCAICLEEFEHKEKVRVLPCKHKFHEDCLTPWLTERHASCPLCKMDVLKHVKEIEKKQKGEDEDENNETASVSSSSPRSFWYRLRGWRLVDGNSVPAEGNTNNPGVSEIEMETMASTTTSPPASTTSDMVATEV